MLCMIPLLQPNSDRITGVIAIISQDLADMVLYVT